MLTLLVPQVGSWRRHSVIAALPAQLAASEWTLRFSAAPGLRLRRIARCTLGKHLSEMSENLQA